MKSRVSIELSFLICAICLAWAATFFALRGGMLSAQNTKAAIVEGCVGYAVCRAISLLPIATQWARHTKFFVTVSVGAFVFYLYIVWTNAIS